ncbi:MAG TPA: YbdK family carboxylate-amine ligase [Gaiella sp.]|nr:YbdK family carboxylate-amine ligase [Gaiella sp.]
MKPLSCLTGADASVARLRAAFDASPLSLTVGAEEELMLVDPGDGSLVGAIEDVLRHTGGDARFQAEFRAAQVELVTRPCLSAADVGRELATARLDLDDAIGPGLATMASGSHPTALRPGPLTRGERYRAVARDNPWAARGMLTCGLHVHVGVEGAERALAVYNVARSYLPELAALAANSPFHAGERTGAASTRMLLNRSLARCGVPPAFPDWDAYADFASWGRAGGAIPDTSYHWWDLRLHPGLGTLELRVCDVQTELEDAVGLVALFQALVAFLAERHDAGEALPVHDGYRIAESLWLASHVGTRRELVDLDTGMRRPLADRVAELLEALAPTAEQLGTERELIRVARLAAACGADRQQQIAADIGLEALPLRLAAETVASARRLRTRADVNGDRGSRAERALRMRAVATSA